LKNNYKTLNHWYREKIYCKWIW